jgi:NADP-dependent 3-hydroxy acid dehydrogenase YdfG
VKDKIKRIAGMALILIGGAASGFGAQHAVAYYESGDWRPTADDPVLHGRLRTHLALMEVE